MNDTHVGYYVIRHKTTGELMPQMKRGRGYSHWNPNNLDKDWSINRLNIPRLIWGISSAKRIVSQWFSVPNGRRSLIHSYSGEEDEIVDIKMDGRKKEDLEIVPITIVFGEPL